MTPIASPVWLLAGLTLLPLLTAIGIGIAVYRLSIRISGAERGLDEMRRRIDRDARRTPPVVHAPAVPRGPRARGGPSASESTATTEPSAPALSSSRTNVPTLIAVPNLADNAPAPENPLADEIRDFEDRFAEILNLAEVGMPVAEIARACGMPAGQVELIVGLGRRLRRPAQASSPHS